MQVKLRAEPAEDLPSFFHPQLGLSRNEYTWRIWTKNNKERASQMQNVSQKVTDDVF